MISSIISRVVILVFGTLYPAYASYKAVRTKNLKEYVKWMMYWIVFALFTCTETFTDVFLSWFPFYYEVKIVLVLWLLSPATKGSSILYRKFVHPALCRREQEIDEYISKAKDQGYHTVLNLGTKGVNYATTVIMQTAIKGGGGLVQQLRKSYSLSDLSECEPREERPTDEADDVLAEPLLIRRSVVKSGYNTRRSASESNSRTPIYFPEVDVDVRTARSRTDEPDFSHIKSSEDISSGYSSADNSVASLTRHGSIGARGRPRARTAVTNIKRPKPAEDSEVIIEELHDEDSLDYSNMPPLLNVPSPIFLSHSDPPFLYHYVGDQVRIIQVLGDYPLNNSIRSTDDIDREIDKQNVKQVPIVIDSQGSQDLDKNNNCDAIAIKLSFTENPSNMENCNEEANTEIIPEPSSQSNINPQFDEKSGVSNVKQAVIKNVSDMEILKEDTTIETEPINIINDSVPKEQTVETASSEILDNYSGDSDDEASFGTPEDSPKSKRKSSKGRYGKGKAPPPPKSIKNNEMNDVSSITSQESLADILNTLPSTSIRETGSPAKLAVNPIAENKMRHKSKSPGRIPKGNSSTIGKLLNLPGKIAFWNKNSGKSKVDNLSTSSGDHSRRSSTIENVDEFQSCTDLSKIILETKADNSTSTKDNKTNIQHNLRDACELDKEIASHDIMEKSDVLKKLIAAKIESHPEYKYSSTENETQSTSKITDV